MAKLGKLVIGLTCLALGSTDAWAQQRRITGQILGEGNTPLAGASVVVSGTSMGTYSNDEGRYSVSAPSTDVTLLVRRIGYKRSTVAVPAGQSEANVTLAKDVLQLEGVVVTGAATTSDRENATTAVTTVSAEQLTKVNSQSLEQSLQGKIVGANINMNGGAPGGGGQIQIRGVTSVNGQGDPLYVIDGVIISNATIASGQNSITRAGGGIATNQDNNVNRLADINPNDIESIEVLKGAAASAIYGSKATNGVIVITTKRGKGGAPRISLTQRAGGSTLANKIGSRNFSGLPLHAGVEAGGDSVVVDSIYKANGNKFPFYDYQEDLYSHGTPSWETIVTLLGGSDNGNTRYYASVTNKEDRGILLNTSAKKQSLRINVDQLFGSRWTLSLGANILRTNAKRGLSNNDNTFTSPIYGLGYTPAIIDLQRKNAITGRPINNPFAGGGTQSSNPFQTLPNIKNDENVYRQIGSANLQFEALNTPSNRVRFTAIGGVDRFDQDNQVYSPNFLQFEPRDNFLGTSVQGNGNSRQVNGSLNAVWTFTPSGMTWLNATTSTGGAYEERYQNVYRIQGQGLIPTVPLASQGTIATNQTVTKVVDNALFAQEELLLFDRLTVAAAMRAERSSVNGDRDKYFIFPKLSGAYRFEEPIRFIDDFKLRASVGKSGNQPNYGSRDITVASTGLIGGSSTLAAASTVGNPNIEPEKMTEIEYGFDASFFKQRLAFEATRFDREINDLLLFAPLAISTGLGSQVINGGQLKSEGWELGATIAPVQTRNFSWISRTTYYTFESIITELPVNSFNVGSSGFGTAYGRSRIGCPGFTPSGTLTSSTLGKCGGSGTVGGQSVKVDPISTTAIWGNKPTGTPGVSKDTVLGESTPDFQMNFTNDFTYKAVSLSFLFDWRKGSKVSSMTNNLFDEGFNSWDYDKPSPNSAIGTSLGDYRYNLWDGGRNTGVYIQDAGFVKLREITLAYAVPSTWLNKLPGGARDVRLSVQGRNLKTWTDYWGFDPEVGNNFGNQNVSRFVDLAPFPPARSFFFSVDVAF